MAHGYSVTPVGFIAETAETTGIRSYLTICSTFQPCSPDGLVGDVVLISDFCHRVSIFGSHRSD